jgi:thiosulfate/3-mercaptopyruvate sulfurtransferase
VSEIALDELASRLGDVAVVDVRSTAEFEGSAGYDCDPRQGHIPGAIHLDVQELLLLDADGIRARLALPDGAEVVVYCHSGARSATAAQVLRAVGYDARNFAGSWHEWSRTDLPAE